MAGQENDRYARMAQLARRAQQVAPDALPKPDIESVDLFIDERKGPRGVETNAGDENSAERLLLTLNDALVAKAEASTKQG